MKTTDTLVTTLLAFCALTIIPLTGWAEEDAGIEITRDTAEIDILIRDHDPDVIDTALVLTNQLPRKPVVRCVAPNHNGEVIGRAFVRVPPHGVRLMLASDIAGGTDFVGTINCASRGHIVGSGFILGAAFSNTPVTNQFHFDRSAIRVQAAASY